MMRIGLDARALNSGRLRGMGKVLLPVLERALEDPDIEVVLFGEEPSLPMSAPVHPRLRVETWEVPGSRFRMWEQVGMPMRARQLRCDVLHATGTWAPAWQPVPTVVTVHDTIPWDDRSDVDGRSSTFFLDRVQPLAYRRARAILTPSESSRVDVVRRWPSLEPKVRALPWGVDERYTAASVPGWKPLFGVRPPYLLYFGGDIPRKRPEWAIRTWHEATPPGVQLVACGLREPSFERCRAMVPPERRGEFIPLPFVEEADLPALYAHSHGVLYPTLYEGFGFPALEAQALGRPIAMSALGSLRELVGPAAIVVAPDDAQAWIAACRTMIAQPVEPNLAARAWARRFSWTRVADGLLDVYRQAAGTTR